jgi:MoaA/NifB/PqqE/SkfB family radical SAM enzyme
MKLAKVKKFIFGHPALLQAGKIILTNKHLANSQTYRKLVMKKAKSKSSEMKEYKKSIAIETVLSCNSRCVFCAHNRKSMTGTMTKELYEKIIDECHEYGIKHIMFGVYGEIMMDSLLFERIEYLRKFGMTYGFISNASLLTSEKTDRLLKLGGLTYVQFSANAFSKEIYEKTMVGLKREVSYKNILYFLDQKEKLKKDELAVSISAVKTSLNKKDLKDFVRFWKKQKGVSMILPIDLMDRMGEEYKEELGKLGRLNSEKNWLAPCRFLWDPLMIYYDGRVSPCCKDNDKRELIVGDVSKETIREVLEGKALCGIRELHLNDKRKSHPVCQKCNLNSVWFG